MVEFKRIFEKQERRLQSIYSPLRTDVVYRRQAGNIKTKLAKRTKTISEQ